LQQINEHLIYWPK